MKCRVLRNEFQDAARSADPEIQLWGAVLKEAIHDKDYEWFFCDWAKEIIEFLDIDYRAFLGQLEKRKAIYETGYNRGINRRFV